MKWLPAKKRWRQLFSFLALWYLLSYLLVLLVIETDLPSRTYTLVGFLPFGALALLSSVYLICVLFLKRLWTSYAVVTLIIGWTGLPISYLHFETHISVFHLEISNFSGRTLALEVFPKFRSANSEKIRSLQENFTVEPGDTVYPSIRSPPGSYGARICTDTYGCFGAAPRCTGQGPCTMTQCVSFQWGRDGELVLLRKECD